MAFGASAAIGGTVSVPVHLDCVVLDATLELDGEPVLAGGQLVVRSEIGHGTIVRSSIPYANLVAVPGMSSGPIEDVEPQSGVEDHDTSERGFLGRLFGR